MSPNVVQEGEIRRHLLVIAVGEYQPRWSVIREEVEAEAAKAERLFLDLLQYERSTYARITDTTQSGIRNGIRNWVDRIPPSDLAVVYYTGHGVTDRSIFYLITSEVCDGKADLAMPAAQLIPTIFQGNRDVLLMLDTCQSGAGIGDVESLLHRLRESQGGAARNFSISLITTARAVEDARANAFIDALDAVIRRGYIRTESEYLRPDALIECVNEIVEGGKDGGADFRQHVRHSIDGEKEFRFFPNPFWQPRLRVGLRAGEARRILGRIHESTLRSHWAPRARGVAQETEPGWLFTGRGRAARALVEWMGSGAERMLVVTGPPGCGKSALLARMVTLADPNLRELARAEGALEETTAEEMPPAASVSAAVYARSKAVADIALEVAVALDADLRSGETNPEVLARTAVEARVGPAVVVIDALDESENPEKVASFLRSLAGRAKNIHVVIGLRGHAGDTSRLMDALGRFRLMDLESFEFQEWADIRRYVERCLLLPGSPYMQTGQEEHTVEVASAVAARANGSFLVAYHTARSLAKRAAVIGTAELDQLPRVPGEAFEFDFKLLGEAERQEAIAVFGALAFAQGRGLPGNLWAPFASALGPNSFSDRDIARWVERSGTYITRDRDSGTEVTRLYHEEFVRFLRQKVSEGALGPQGTPGDPEGNLADFLEALAPMDPANGERRWEAAPPYVRRYLPRHLRAAERYGSLYSLVLNQRWVSMRTEGGDPSPLLEDLDLAIDAAAGENPPQVAITARCCMAYGRRMTTAPPLIVDVLTAVGQAKRAVLIADNITYPLDRCQAFCFLVERNWRSDPAQAAQQLGEAMQMRSLSSSYAVMTAYWVVHALKRIGATDLARERARWQIEHIKQRIQLAEEQMSEPRSRAERVDPTVVWESVFSLFSGSGEGSACVMEPPIDAGMERSHTLFWAAMASREAGDEEGLAYIRSLPGDRIFRGSNLQLQAAAVAGDRVLLESFLPWRSGTLPDAPGGILHGNLALALATAGMCEDAIRLLESTRTHWEQPSAHFLDSAKRLAWALALCGRYSEALAYAESIPNAEECLRALYRVTQVLLDQKRDVELGEAADSAERFLAETRGGFPEADVWRLRSWAAWILMAAGLRERAAQLAEAVCAEGINPSEENSLNLPTKTTLRMKQHVEIPVGEHPDYRSMLRAQRQAADGDWEQALKTAKGIASARHRARALAAVAAKYPDGDQARRTWLSALIAARQVGEGLVREVLWQGLKLVEASDRPGMEELLGSAEGT